VSPIMEVTFFEQTGQQPILTPAHPPPTAWLARTRKWLRRPFPLSRSRHDAA